MIDKPPTQDPIVQPGKREWEPKSHKPTLTFGTVAYKTYSTYVYEDLECRVLMNTD